MNYINNKFTQLNKKSEPKLKNTYTYKSKPKMVITDEFLNKVKYLCKKISKVEWSGMLMYSIEGTMDDMSNLVITPKDILLMDIGSGAHTSFDYDPLVISDAYINNTEWIDKEYRKGLIHSHVDMGVYFSGEDMSELHDNAKFYDFYLSLIVNNRSELTAKICFEGSVEKKTETVHKYKNSNNVNMKFTSSENINEDILFIADCDIVREEVEEINTDFDKRIKEIKESKAKIPTKGVFTRYYENEYYDFPSSFSNNNKVSKNYDMVNSLKVREPFEVDFRIFIASCINNTYNTKDKNKTFYDSLSLLNDIVGEELKNNIDSESYDSIIESVLDNIFIENDMDSYDINIFNVYKEKIDRAFNHKNNKSLEHFISFLEKLCDYLTSLLDAEDAEYIDVSAILIAIISYIEDFSKLDRRLDLITT